MNIERVSKGNYKIIHEDYVDPDTTIYIQANLGLIMMNYNSIMYFGSTDSSESRVVIMDKSIPVNATYFNGIAINDTDSLISISDCNTEYYISNAKLINAFDMIYDMLIYKYEKIININTDFPIEGSIESVYDRSKYGKIKRDGDYLYLEYGLNTRLRFNYEKLEVTVYVKDEPSTLYMSDETIRYFKSICNIYSIREYYVVIREYLVLLTNRIFDAAKSMPTMFKSARN